MSCLIKPYYCTALICNCGFYNAGKCQYHSSTQSNKKQMHMCKNPDLYAKKDFDNAVMISLAAIHNRQNEILARLHQIKSEKNK